MKKIENCLCCNNDNLITILDLNKQPLANSYHKIDEKLDEFPLALNLCSTCYHLQLTHAIDPDLMFKNYLYVSGTTNTLKKYFEWFASFTLSYKPDGKSILDIACNDGTQLDSFKKLGLTTYGIDPAENISLLSKDKGHEIIVDYFNEQSIEKLNGQKFDIITAQNVFAHNTYPLEFLKMCNTILNDGGYLFIQTSQANMVKNNEFDTIYHEHISFFNVNSMKCLVERSGLILNDVVKTDIHGTSFVFVISRNTRQESNLTDMLDTFSDDRLDKLETYFTYGFSAKNTVVHLKNIIEEYRLKNYKIVGYGAAAKGNTLLNFGQINLNYIVDDNELKNELYTPGMNILIKHPNFISEIDCNTPILFVPLAWNFYKEIKEKIKNIRNNENDLFVLYFPKIKIEN